MYDATSVALSLVSGIGFGLAPALKASRVDLVPALREEATGLSLGRQRFGLKNVLVVSQVALSCVLLLAAGIVVRMLIGARDVDFGFAVDGVALLETNAPYAGYADQQATALYEELRRRMAALPGVEAVGLSNMSPVNSVGPLARAIVIPGYEPASGEAGLFPQWTLAGSGYFDTLRIPVVYGRAFDEFDRGDSLLVAMVSLDAAAMLAPMQRVLRELDAKLPVLASRTMADEIEQTLTVGQAAAGFLGGLGLLGLALASVGLHAVVVFAVSRRKLEVGIRMALGARPRQVAWLVTREVAFLVDVGLALGFGLSLAATRALNAALSATPGVNVVALSADGLMLGTAMLLLMATVGLTAAYLPSRRAAGMNPLTALRHQ